MPCFGADGDADAAGRVDLLAVDEERLAQFLDEARGKALGVVDARDARLQDGELVAAEARHHVGVADVAHEPLGDGAEQRVADRMAERVVDALEVVEVDAHHGEHARLVLSRFRQRLLMRSRKA